MPGAGEGMRRSFASEPASVSAARRAVAEFASRWGMAEPRLGDLKTTVSEACANVVTPCRSRSEAARASASALRLR